MATVKISIDNDPVQSFRVQLDGVDYVIDLFWNQRQHSWKITLRDSDGEAIKANDLLSPSFPLFITLDDDRKPDGELILIDNFAGPYEPLKDPCLDDLATRYSLVYIEAVEL